MQRKTWKYYNHAMIPTTPPHMRADEEVLNDKSFWKKYKKVLFVRWTTDFDCKEKTNWWYVIKDSAFDISSIKSKRRYEINKGIRYFDVVKVNPKDFKRELYEITCEAYQSWSERDRPKISYEEYIKSINDWDDKIVYGAFHKEEKKICGYALLTMEKEYLDFNVLRVIPAYEKCAINAAIVNKIVLDNNDFMTNGGYICDGSRSINHETAFQEYLEKYFGFRKAYCRLHIEYNPMIKWFVKMVYPIRGLLKRMDDISVVHKINSVLKMEEICRGGE